MKLVQRSRQDFAQNPDLRDHKELVRDLQLLVREGYLSVENTDEGPRFGLTLKGQHELAEHHRIRADKTARLLTARAAGAR